MKAISFILALFLPFAVLFGVFYKVYPALAKSGQTFDSIIIENVAKSGYNKSGELTLFWVLACVAIVLTLVILWIVQSGFFSKQMKNPSADFSGKWNLIGIVLLPFIAHTVIYGKISPACLLGLLYFFIIMIYTRKKEQSVACCLLLPVLTYYSVMAVLTCGVRLSDSFALSTGTIYGITVAATLLLFGISRLCKISLPRLVLIMQIPIPFLLVLFLVDEYLYRGSLIRVAYAPFYYVFFGGLLVVFLALILIHGKKHWKPADKLSASHLVHYATAITIFVYNSWSACPMYAQPDQHHHGEQMIPWQQIVTLGQSAYEEYTPVSGLFPMVNGFIQNVLLGGTVSDYSPAITIMMTLFCVVTMYLICRHVGGAYGLLIGIFFALPSYNRQYMVLPVLLLLFLPDLLEKPGLWIKTWIFSCFLAGLYYPLYGAAVLVGTVPLGIHMFLRMLRETNWKEVRKKPSFYLGWLICLLPILLCIPLLLRMVTHTLTYSGQTILADGISLYGQSAPDFFLPYLAGNHENLRLWLYYGLRFFLPMVPLVVGSSLCFLVWKNKTRTLSEKKYLLYGFVAVIISLCISYSYTLVRADTGMILSRTAPVLISVMGIFLPVLLIKYGKGLLPRFVCIFITGLCFALPLVLYHNVSAMKFPDMWIYPNGEADLIMDDSDKLFSYYEVPETFLSMKEIELSDTSMLGEGFMVADQVGYLEQYDSVMEKCVAVAPETCYMGFDGQGFYYYLNAKACSTGFIQAGKGYEAQQAILKQAKEKRPVIFLMEPQSTYYVYVWMMTSDYRYCHEDGAFYPKELYEKLYPENPSGDDYRLYCPATDFGLVADSFGASADSLMPLFEAEKNVLTSDASSLSIPGKEYDFLYLSLKDTVLTEATSLQITFLCNGERYEGASVTCLTGDGNLLIPLGMNADWLLSENSQITFSFLNEAGEQIAVLPLEGISQVADDCRFLSLMK